MRWYAQLILICALVSMGVRGLCMGWDGLRNGASGSGDVDGAASGLGFGMSKWMGFSGWVSWTWGTGISSVVVGSTL
jgi:hypothetical protein